MKKGILFVLAAALAAAALAGCSKGSEQTERTPEELQQLYSDAITENGGEMVEYNPVVTEVKEDDMSDMMLEIMGIQEEDTKAFALSTSLMNTQAYGIAAVMPAEGKEQSVKEGLQGFIDLQRQNFERYLPDQYEIAQNAKLETLEDGTVLLVMCEDQDAVFDGISAAVQGE